MRPACIGAIHQIDQIKNTQIPRLHVQHMLACILVCVCVYKFGTWSFIASMVTRKIWLKQCHRNNLLPYFFPAFNLLFSFGIHRVRCWMIRFGIVCAWIVCTRICKCARSLSGISAFQRFRRFHFMYMQSTNLQFTISMFDVWCFISHRFNHIEFVSIWLFDILFERVCGIRFLDRSFNRQKIFFSGEFSEFGHSFTRLRSRFAFMILPYTCTHCVFMAVCFGLAWLGLAYT